MPNTGTRAGLKKNDLGIFRYSGPIEPARATQQSKAVPQKSSPTEQQPHRAAVPRCREQSTSINVPGTIKKPSIERETPPIFRRTHGRGKTNSGAARADKSYLLTSSPKVTKTRQKAMAHVRAIPQNSRRNPFGRGASSPEKAESKSIRENACQPKKKKKRKKLPGMGKPLLLRHTPRVSPLDTTRRAPKE